MKRITTGAAAALLAFATGSAVGVTPPNYQYKAPQRATAAHAAAQKLARTDSARFHWATERSPSLPLSPLTADKRPDAAARSALTGAAGKLGMTADSVNGAELRDLHDLGRGPVIARYQQKYEGLDVFGATVNVIMDRNLKPVAYSGSFVKAPSGSSKAPASYANSSPFAIGTSTATQAALRDLGQSSKTPGLNLVKPGNVARMYYPAGGKMIPAYRLSIRAAQVDGARSLTYGYLVSAADGTILVRKNLTADADFTYRVYADDTAPFKPFDGPLGNARTPFQGAGPSDNPARTPVASNLVQLETGPISTLDPWQAASATTTTGNNVRAYPDANQPDGLGGDSLVIQSSNHAFNYTATADASPTFGTARNAGVVNMFFITNWLHDFWYDHGFNEAAGNAQLSNLNRGGVEGDPILAESQDFEGRNNANMSTPGDGESPIMQMFLWDGGVSSLEVTAPALGTFFVGTAEFGDQAFDLTDDVVAVDDGDTSLPNGTVTDGCEAFGGVTGMIALIDRGACDFTVKAANAQSAGAVGAIIVNNVPNDGAIGMSGDTPPSTIPVLSVSLEDGQQIKDGLAVGAVTVRMLREAAPDRDAALDNGVIAHEFFHYVSNRLVNDAFGLINQQGGGMGEGWSDFNTMMLIVRPEDQALSGNDTWAGIYSTGVYVDNSAYFGIRRAPYSTDFAVNPLTFQHIQDGVPLPNTAPLQYGQSGEFNSEVHSTGEIWANMLWEVYAALLNDPRYTFAQAQGRMQDYVIAGLKALNITPTFIEARDGILAAARATDMDDYELIAAAFAKRGMGAGAIGPDRDSNDNVGVTESYVALAAQYVVEDFSVDNHYDDGNVGYCDTDLALDPGETAQIRFTVRSAGTLDLPAGATIQVSTDGDADLENGGLVTLPALAVGETTDVALTLTLNSAGGTAEPLTVTLDFPQVGATPDEVFEPATMDEVLNVNLDVGVTRVFDDVELAEASEADWSVALSDPNSGPRWVVTDDFDSTFGTGGVWYAHDNSSEASSTLTTPTFAVAPATAFSMTFTHFFEFEPPDGGFFFDGGVVEISIDGGAFQDVTAAGGSFAPSGYNGNATAFGFPAGRPAFVGTNDDMTVTTLSFGNALAGHTARIRFRLETDVSVGAFGWVIDDITLNGITNPVFSAVVTENGVCVNHPAVVNAGTDQVVDERTAVNLAGSAVDFEGDTLTYAWSRVSGPNVTLTNANTPAASFTAPGVSANTPITLRLTVNDGTDASTDDVVVTVNNTGGGGGGGGGGGALGGEFVALAGLLALLRRRRSAP